MVNLGSLNPWAPTVTATTEIADLRIYPIKSCRGISVPLSRLTRKGLEFDRQWMFVDASTNKFVTIRDISELTLIDTSLEQDAKGDSLSLAICIRNQPSTRFAIPARPTPSYLSAKTSLEEVEIWGVKTDAHVYTDPAISEEISAFLSRPVKLAFKGPTARILRGNGAPQHLGRTESTNFPDVLPVLIANQASIIELNSRLKARKQDEITIERFRPNIIVRGGESDSLPAWSEDNWKSVRVVTAPPASGTWLPSGPSTLDIDVSSRCARCQVPNVDPETAEKNKKEPWDTLMGYRRIDQGMKYKPCFGMLACPRAEGEIMVGMPFEVVETTENHFLVKGF